jgi:hypothetical protein
MTDLNTETPTLKSETYNFGSASADYLFDICYLRFGISITPNQSKSVGAAFQPRQTSLRVISSRSLGSTQARKRVPVSSIPTFLKRSSRSPEFWILTPLCSA